MNALQRDLKKLVPLVESLGAEKAASDPHRQKFHIQPMVPTAMLRRVFLRHRCTPAVSATAISWGTM